MWTAVKGEYRIFVSGGQAAQIVTVDYTTRLAKLYELVANLDLDALANAADQLLRRMTYVEFFSVVLVYVPANLPHTLGAILWDAIIRPFMPRLLFVDKDEIDDTARTNLYTGGLAGSSEGTSISLGYIAEAYIDFGTFGMFAALVAIGLFYGADLPRPVALAALARPPRHGGGNGRADERRPHGEQLHQGVRRRHRLPRRRLGDDRVHRAALGPVAGAAGADAPAPRAPRHSLRVAARRRPHPGDRHHRARPERGGRGGDDADDRPRCRTSGRLVRASGMRTGRAASTRTSGSHPYKVAPGLVPRLMQAVERHDVVHIHALFSFASTVAAWVAHRRRVPYVVRPLGTLSSYGLRARRRRLKRLSMALIESRMLRHAAAVHFTSRAELDEAEALGLPMRSVVIPLGVEVGAYGRPPRRWQHRALAGRRVILFLSRLDPKKNVEALIDAVASSPMLRSSCALLIAGTGEPGYVASLRARAAAAGLSDRTVWLGHVEGAQKRAALAAADVFVLPSFSENFGIAAVEALLAGVPCVLGEGVAVAREVEKRGAGLAVPPEPAAVAQALERILGADASVRRDMALRAKRVAESKYSTRAMAQRLVSLYKEISERVGHSTVDLVQ